MGAPRRRIQATSGKLARARTRAGAAIGLLAALACACSDGGGVDGRRDDVEAVLSHVEAPRLKRHVDVLASDAMEGRRPGSAGHRLALAYLVDQLAAAALTPAGDGGGYVHRYPTVQEPQYLFPYTTGQNAVFVHRGHDPRLAHEMVVLMAHYDGLGRTRHHAILNGAYDDAAGVSLLIELARAYRLADYRPRRSVVFLLTDEEESNSNGADRWVRAPTLGSTADVVLGISVDPVGRPNLPGYMWTGLLGLERSPTLEARVRERMQGWSREDVVALHNDTVPEVLNSDHDWFHMAGVPALWFVNPGFSYYHTIFDAPETVDYRVLLESARVLAELVDLVANDDRRYPYVDAPPFTLENVLPVTRVYERFLERDDVLTPSELDYARGVLAGMERIRERGHVDPEADANLFLAGTAGIFAFALAHPGEVPPPFPGSEP